MIHVIVPITAEDGFPPDFMAFMKDLVEKSRKEEGCIYYEVAEDYELGGETVARKNTLTFIEKWES